MFNYNFTLGLISPLLLNGVSTAMKDLNQTQIEDPQIQKNQTHCSCSQEKDEPVMTLNEAIRHAEEKGQGTSNCAKNHQQLARWLKELKHFRDRNRSVTRIPNKPETTKSKIAEVYKAPMTLDEAISYADTKAGDRKTYAEQQYSRVAGWLQELKMRRELFPQKTEEQYVSWLRKVRADRIKADRAINAEHYKRVEIPHTAVAMTPEIKEYINSILKDMYEDKKEEALRTVKDYIDKAMATIAAMSSNKTTKDNKQSSPSTIPKDRGVNIDIKDIDDMNAKILNSIDSEDDDEYL